jgi:hypothetical protein
MAIPFLSGIKINTAFASAPSDSIFLYTGGSNTPGGGSEIIFGSSTSASTVNYNAKIAGVRSALDNGSSDLQFLTTHVTTATTPSTKMTIKSDGRIGIGTVNPESKLTIKGDPSNTNQPTKITNSSTDNHTGLFLNGTGNAVNEKYGLQFGGYNEYSIGGIFGVMDSVSASTSGDITIDFGNGTASGALIERVRFTHEGRVGIGTDNPGYKLEISEDGGDNGTADLFFLRNTNSTRAQTFQFQLDTAKDLVITGSSGAGGFNFVSGTRGATFNKYVNAGTGFRMASGQAIDFINSNIGYNSIERNTTLGGLQINTGGTASLNILDNSDASFAGSLSVSDIPFNSTSVSVLVADEILGSNLITNGDFSASTGWGVGSGWTISSGKASVDTASTVGLTQSISVVSGNVYKVSLEVSDYTSGSLQPQFGGSQVISQISANGKYVYTVTSSVTNTVFYLYAVGDAEFTVDNVSVKQITSASDQIKKREISTDVFTGGPFLPLAGGTMTGSLFTGYIESNSITIDSHAPGNAVLTLQYDSNQDSPATVDNNDILGAIHFKGIDDSANNAVTGVYGKILATSDGLWDGSGNRGIDLSFHTGKYSSGSVSTAVALTLDKDQNATFAANLETKGMLSVRDASSNHQVKIQATVGGTSRIMAHNGNTAQNHDLDIVSTQIDFLTGSITGSDNSRALFLDSSRNATFTGDILTNTDSSSDIGKTDARWANLWVDTINGGSPVTGGPFLPISAGSTKPLTGSLYFNNSVHQLLWPHTSGQSTSRSWSFIGEQGSYGKFELRMSDAADDTPDTTVLEFNRNNVATFKGSMRVQSDDGDKFLVRSNDYTIARIISRGTGANLDKGLFSLMSSDGTNNNVEKVRIDSAGLSWFDGGSVRIGGDLDVIGNLTVGGTTTTLNTETVEVEDNILQLNTTQGTSGNADTATAATSGISIYRGDGVTQASLIFDDADDTWDLTDSLKVASGVFTNSIYLTDKIRFLNKAGDGWLTLATINTSASEAVYDLTTIGTVNASGTATFGGTVRTDGYLQVINASAEIWIGDTLSGGDGGFIKWNSTNDYLYIGNSYNSAYNEDIKIDNTGKVTFGSNVQVKNALIDNASVTSATTTTTVASVSGTTYAAVFFDYVIYKSSNIRAGTVVACSDGTSVSFTETSTTDLGDTSDVTLAVDYSSSNFRLRATTTSSTWNIKAIIRAI